MRRDDIKDNKRIKFRAFNSALNTMTYNVGINPFSDDYFVFDKDGAIIDMYGSCPALMQYTGLKDKNGKEIYDGDIVRFNQHVTHEDIIGEIVFISCGFHIHYRKNSHVQEWISLPLNEEDQETMEVIDNIYENPELLKLDEATG